MKRILYSVTALLTIFMVGCTKFDEATSEQYAPAPDFSIDATAAVADSSATFKIAIDKVNTTRFAVALLNDSVAVGEYPESMTLLKGNVDPKARVCKFNADTLAMRSDTTVSYVYKDLLVQITGSEISYTYSGLEPNTPYTFVAVVSNKFGMTGDVKGLPVTTTDNLAPAMSKASRSESYGSLTLAFSENMQRGDGKVSVKYYAPYDFSITGTVPEENIKCEIKGKEVSISCDSVPAGALMLVSWEAGAFKDIKGNNCNAVVTEMNMKTGRVDNGCYFMIANEPFSFTKAGVEKLGETFVDYTTFMPTISYNKPLYVQYDEDDESAEISLLYVKDDVQVLLPALWDVADSAIVIGFKKEMDYGAKVSFSIPAGAVVDAFGNPNKAFVVEDAWMRSYGLTDNDIVGLYDVVYVNQNGTEVQTSMLVTRSGDALKVSRLFVDQSCLDAYFDGDMGILYIEDWQYMYSRPDRGWDIYFATNRDEGYAQLQYNPDTKSFYSDYTAEFFQYVADAESGSPLGYLEYTTEVLATYADDQNYGYDKDLMVGDYRFIYHSYFDEEDPNSLDTITCSIVAGDNDTTLIIKDFVFAGSEVVAYFDTVSGKLVIPDWQFLGLYYDVYECYMSTYDLEDITFVCSPDGSALADGSASPNNMLWGVPAMNGEKMAGWLLLSEGDLYLEPYEPEEEPAPAAAPMRQASTSNASFELHTDMLPRK